MLEREDASSSRSLFGVTMVYQLSSLQNSIDGGGRAGNAPARCDHRPWKKFPCCSLSLRLTTDDADPVFARVCVVRSAIVQNGGIIAAYSMHEPQAKRGKRLVQELLSNPVKGKY